MSTGVTVKVDLRYFRRSLSRLMRKVRDQRTMWEEIGLILRKSVDENFEQEGRPNWDEWSPAYGETKPAGDKILTGSGDLRRTIDSAADAEGVTIFSPEEYAAIHQFGGQTKPHEIKARFASVLHFFMGATPIFAKAVQHPGSKIPARPFLMVQDEDYEKMADTVEQYLLEGW